MLARLRTLLVGAVIVLAVVAIGLGRTLSEAPGDPVDCDDPVAWDAAGQVVGESAAIEGPVTDVTHAPEVGGAPTFLNLGAAHPEEPRFDVVVYEDTREAFDAPLEDLEGATVCVVGEVRTRDGVPQIVLGAPPQLERRD